MTPNDHVSITLPTLQLTAKAEFVDHAPVANLPAAPILGGLSFLADLVPKSLPPVNLGTAPSLGAPEIGTPIALVFIAPQLIFLPSIFAVPPQ